MSGRATQFLEKMHSVGGPFFIQYVCLYPKLQHSSSSDAGSSSST